MELLWIVVLGTLLSGIWFGLNIVINVVANKTKINFLAKYSVLFSALFPTILILKYSTLDLWNVKSVLNWRNWLSLQSVFLIIWKLGGEI